jgi:predicted nucleic acid-binding protein
MFLLDTDVLVECLRGMAAARDWLASAPSAESGINQSGQREVRKFVALSRHATLYTFNLKHFQKIPELDCREPYVRS